MVRVRSFAGVAFALLVGLGSLGSAQDDANEPLLSAAESLPPWKPGTRLRITAIGPEGQRRIGLYEALRDHHLLVQTDGRSHSVPLEAIRRIEVSRGHRPSVLWGVVGGLLGGAVGALSAGCLANRDDYGVPCAGQDDTKFVIGGVVGGLAGGAVGALLGREEQWDLGWPRGARLEGRSATDRR